MYNFEEPPKNCVLEWTYLDVVNWLVQQGLNDEIFKQMFKNDYPIDGLTLISLTSEDLKYLSKRKLTIKQIKHLNYKIQMLNLIHSKNCPSANCSMVKSLMKPDDTLIKELYNNNCCQATDCVTRQQQYYESESSYGGLYDSEQSINGLRQIENDSNNGSSTPYLTLRYKRSPRISLNNSRTLQTEKSETIIRNHEIAKTKDNNELWKCFISLIYYLCGGFLACLTMVYSHSRVPDMTQYPPLPDIVLDILPLITWAFEACELLILVMMFLFSLVVLFHKHRLIVLKRFFAICGTIFGMRSVTLTVTTLSVPGRHLNCRSERAWEIMKGGGLSLNGLRTCGDYMFSGHSSYVTVLLMFITEYSSSKIYMLHNATCVMWGFALFFILAGHEHYTIDVVCAVYIATRIFHYYHTLASAVDFNRRKAKVWHPIFYYLEYPFENDYIHNEYENPIRILYRIKNYFSTPN